MFSHYSVVRVACACFALFFAAQVLAADLVSLNGSTPAQPVARKFKILVLTQSMGYKHSVVTRPANPPGALCTVESALAELGTKSGVFEAECTQDATVITPEKLKELDALIFFTSGDLPLKPAAFGAIQEWLRSGKAFIGIHSAADTFKEFKPYYEMIGATFLRHPWPHGATLTNLDPEHPATKMFRPNFDWNDELCEYHYFEPRKVRVLLSVNMSESDPKIPKAIPVAWVREYGKGRVFYTNLGHSEAAWSDRHFRAHLLGGIRWALKLDAGSAEPNPDAMAQEDIKARLAVLDSEKNWLTRAAQTGGFDPTTVLAAAEKLATSDKAGFAKMHERIRAARADELARESALKKSQKPNVADIKLVQSRRIDIVQELLPKRG